MNGVIDANCVSTSSCILGLQDVVEMARVRLQLLELEQKIKTIQMAKDTTTKASVPDLEALTLESAQHSP
jgi:hypothetical protein